jgi:deazaflavin-dependent oxidoreductase (nitroreductase family)
MGQPKDTAFRFATGLHRSVFTATNGRLLGKMAGMPVVLLRTTGRKSGQRRETMLTSPVQEGDTVVLVASYGGDPHHPAWFLNLEAHPEAEIVMGGRRSKVKARVATPDEKARLWPQVTAKYRSYEGYQRKTTRDIPLVLLDPA